MDTTAATSLFSRHPLVDLRKGVDCPDCGRFVKVNRKRLNRTMLQYLKLLYDCSRTQPGEFVQGSRLRIKAATNIEESPDIQTGDYKILAVWGLVELHSEKPGFVRVTLKGIDFVEGRARVPGAVLLENYKNRFVEFDPETPHVSFIEASTTTFKVTDL